MFTKRLARGSQVKMPEETVVAEEVTVETSKVTFKARQEEETETKPTSNFPFPSPAVVEDWIDEESVDPLTILPPRPYVVWGTDPETLH